MARYKETPVAIAAEVKHTVEKEIQTLERRLETKGWILRASIIVNVLLSAILIFR